MILCCDVAIIILTQIKVFQFFGKIAKSNTRAFEAILVREICYKRNSSLLMKTIDLFWTNWEKETKTFALPKQNDWKMQDEEVHF